MVSVAVQDYLKAIYHLTRDEQAAATSAIAERLGLASGSVTGMLKRLADDELVAHVPYYGARLTPAGEQEAVRLIRRHRVLELFLVDVLGYTWDRVHEEAERLEHAVSEELIDRMAHVLGGPAEDPHGAPIPEPGVVFEDRRFPALADLEVGCPAVLRRVPDEDGEALRYLAGLSLTPGVEVEVLERAPFNGPLRVRVGEAEEYLGSELAGSIEVEVISPDGAAGE